MFLLICQSKILISYFNSPYINKKKRKTTRCIEKYDYLSSKKLKRFFYWTPCISLIYYLRVISSNKYKIVCKKIDRKAYPSNKPHLCSSVKIFNYFIIFMICLLMHDLFLCISYIR